MSIQGEQDITKITFSRGINTNGQTTRLGEYNAYDNTLVNPPNPPEQVSWGFPVPSDMQSGWPTGRSSGLFGYPITSMAQSGENLNIITANTMDVGIYFLMGGGLDTNPSNAMVGLIDPAKARLQRATSSAISYNNTSGYATYNGVFDTVICMDWKEFFTQHVKRALDWLQPTKMTNSSSGLQYQPIVYFLAPHGRIGDTREAFNFYDAISARERGLNHLVDGYYEGLRMLKALQVQAVTHIGSPDTHNAYYRRDDSVKELPEWYVRYSQQAVALDASSFFPADTETFKQGERFWRANIPVGIEGTPGYAEAAATSWLSSENPYTINVLGDAFIPRIIPPQAGFASGNYPAAGTSQFSGLYGTGRMWFLKFQYSNWSATTTGGNYSGAVDGNAAQQFQYFRFFANQTRWIKQALIPNAKIMLPHGFDTRCRTLGLNAEYFVTGSYSGGLSTPIQYYG